MARRQVELMASWKNGKLAKWQVGKIVRWQNSMLAKWQVDEMTDTNSH